MQSPALEQARSELSEIDGIEAIDPLYPTLIDDAGTFIEGESPLPWGLKVQGINILDSRAKTLAIAQATRSSILTVVSDGGSHIESQNETTIERNLGWHNDGVYDLAVGAVKTLKRSGQLPDRNTRTGFVMSDNTDFNQIFWEEVAALMKISLEDLRATIHHNKDLEAIVQQGRTDLKFFTEMIKMGALAAVVKDIIETPIGPRKNTFREKSLINIVSYQLKDTPLLERVNRRLCQNPNAYFHHYSSGTDQQLFWVDADQNTTQTPHTLHCAWHKN